MDIAGLGFRYMHIHLLILQNYGRIPGLQPVENQDGGLWSVYMLKCELTAVDFHLPCPGMLTPLSSEGLATATILNLSFSFLKGS